MKIDGKNIRPIWLNENKKTVNIIDQRLLPHKFIITELKNVANIIMAIKEMFVRGAPLIGVTGAFGAYLAALNSINESEKKFDESFISLCKKIKASRPTAVNLVWGVDRIISKVLQFSDISEKIDAAKNEAELIAEEESLNCKKIGEYGVALIEKISREKKGKTVNILTHCNAGWLACIEHGTATAPMYAAFDKGIDIHVWVDETRPLNQGARLTAWELGKYGIKHTVITDNAGGHLMQHSMVDMVIVGTDRSTYTGDVANKIGTYLKALAAKDNNIGFYVALPSSTFDFTLTDGIGQIPIEKRDPDEIRYVQGLCDGEIKNVLISPADSPAANYAFDVTPARLVTGFITERGICNACKEDITALFPERTK